MVRGRGRQPAFGRCARGPAVGRCGRRLRRGLMLTCVITGDSGTGKATVAATIAALLHEKGLVNNPVPKTVDPTDYQKFMDKIDENLKNFGNGVLVIKEADKHVPDGKQKDAWPRGSAGGDPVGRREAQEVLRRESRAEVGGELFSRDARHQRRRTS